MCNPWIAAALNFVLPGAGYVYAGRRDGFAWGVLVSYALIAASSFMSGSATYAGVPQAALYMGVSGTIILQASFAWDAFRVAKAAKKRRK